MQSNTTKVIIFRKNDFEERHLEIINEKSVELFVNGKPWLSFMCTPTNLEALAVGFLYNEGFINSHEEIAIITICNNQSMIDVWLHTNPQKPSTWTKTSGCSGGITSVNLSKLSKIPVVDSFLHPNDVLSIIYQFSQIQSIYRLTGGVHSTALFENKNFWFSTDDVGRHNTLDKIAGLTIMEKKSPKNPLLITTGRISAEMIHKAMRMQLPIVISLSSPTSLSTELANYYGITLIGYAKKHHFTIYTHTNRIYHQQSQ